MTWSLLSALRHCVYYYYYVVKTCYKLACVEPEGVLQKVFSVYFLFPTLTINILLWCCRLEAVPYLFFEPMVKQNLYIFLRKTFTENEDLHSLCSPIFLLVLELTEA